jgi:hypothetical protein
MGRGAGTGSGAWKCKKGGVPAVVARGGEGGVPTVVARGGEGGGVTGGRRRWSAAPQNWSGWAALGQGRQ